MVGAGTPKPQQYGALLFPFSAVNRHFHTVVLLHFTKDLNHLPQVILMLCSSFLRPVKNMPVLRLYISGRLRCVVLLVIYVLDHLMIRFFQQFLFRINLYMYYLQLSKSEECMPSSPPHSPPGTRPASASCGFLNSTSTSLRLAPSSAEPYRMRSCSFDSPQGIVERRKGAPRRSLPVISICDLPFSPCGLVVPRCQSQPSIISEQCKPNTLFLKRRRGEDRPALNFFKMKEVGR